jgi:hypothetical protein
MVDELLDRVGGAKLALGARRCAFRLEEEALGLLVEPGMVDASPFAT